MVQHMAQLVINANRRALLSLKVGRPLVASARELNKIVLSVAIKRQCMTTMCWISSSNKTIYNRKTSYQFEPWRRSGASYPKPKSRSSMTRTRWQYTNSRFKSQERKSCRAGALRRRLNKEDGIIGAAKQSWWSRLGTERNAAKFRRNHRNALMTRPWRNSVKPCPKVNNQYWIRPLTTRELPKDVGRQAWSTILETKRKLHWLNLI